MTGSRIALVTGANQGLGRALVTGLAAGMAPQDRVLLTGRDPNRVEAAAAAIAAGPAVARVEGRVSTYVMPAPSPGSRPSWGRSTSSSRTRRRG